MRAKTSLINLTVLLVLSLGCSNDSKKGVASLASSFNFDTTKFRLLVALWTEDKDVTKVMEETTFEDLQVDGVLRAIGPKEHSAHEQYNKDSYFVTTVFSSNTLYNVRLNISLAFSNQTELPFLDEQPKAYHKKTPLNIEVLNRDHSCDSNCVYYENAVITYQNEQNFQDKASALNEYRVQLEGISNRNRELVVPGYYVKGVIAAIVKRLDSQTETEN